MKINDLLAIAENPHIKYFDIWEFPKNGEIKSFRVAKLKHVSDRQDSQFIISLKTFNTLKGLKHLKMRTVHEVVKHDSITQNV